MRIDGPIILNKPHVDAGGELIKEGDILEGKVLEITDQIATIKVRNLAIFNVFMGKTLNYPEGIVLEFLVKSYLPGRVELEFISEDIENNSKTEDFGQSRDYLGNILGEFAIKEDPIAVQLLEVLIRYNARINRANLLKGIGIYNKMNKILNVASDKSIKFIDTGKGNHDIRRINIIDILIENIEDENTPGMRSISFDEKNFISILKDYLLGTHPNDGIKLELIKTIGFLIKFNIQPTLNNIKYIIELNRNPRLFSEDFKVLKRIADKKFTNHSKGVNIIHGSKTRIISDRRNCLEQRLSKIDELMKENKIPDINITRQTIKELRNKIDFINEMNKELFFVYFPLNLSVRNYEALMTLVKKRQEEDGFQRTFNVFINLTTERLGEIKIFFHILDSVIDIKFRNIAKKDLDLFVLKEDQLREFVNSTGYHVRSIEYSSVNDYYILDALAINKDPIYFLNVQV